MIRLRAPCSSHRRVDATRPRRLLVPALRWIVVAAHAGAPVACADTDVAPDRPDAPAPEGQTAPTPGRILPLRVYEISPDAIVLSGFSNGNLLAVRFDSTLLLVDSQSAMRVEALAATLDSVGFTLPVRTVVNTHYHTDHVGGNAYWRARGARVFAHATAPAEMQKDTFIAELNWRRTPEPAQTMPTDLVTDSVHLGGPPRAVVARHLSSAHTAGDLVVWVPGADVLHMGDIVEIGADPVVDRWAGGTLAGMIDAVRWAL